jgi:hypothetical protein
MTVYISHACLAAVCHKMYLKKSCVIIENVTRRKFKINTIGGVRMSYLSLVMKLELLNRVFLFHAHKMPSFHPIPNHVNLVHTVKPCFA